MLDVWAMLRLLGMLLIVGVGFDHFALDDKYTTVAKTLAYALLERV